MLIIDCGEMNLDILVVLTLIFFKEWSQRSQSARCSSRSPETKILDRAIDSGCWSVLRQWFVNSASVTFVTSNSSAGKTIPLS